MKTYSSSVQQQRFYLVLPLLILPFLTLMYWALIVKNTKNQKASPMVSQGLNPSLPSPSAPRDSYQDKLSFYRKADRDSARLRELLRSDPYRNQPLLQSQDPAGSLLGLGRQYPDSVNLQKNNLKAKGDLHEQKVYEKLQALDAALANAASPAFKSPLPDQTQLDEALPSTPKAAEPVLTALPENKPVMIDPEMAQINQTLDKILQIQHPELGMPVTGSDSVRPPTETFSVEPFENKLPILHLSEATASDSIEAGEISSGFLSLDGPVQPVHQHTLTAQVQGEQSFTDGAIVRLRLTADCSVAGLHLTSGELLFGKASISGERVHLLISSIRRQNALIDVSLSAYDMDGQPGLNLPGSVARSVTKQSISQNIQGVDLGALDRSLGAQAASAGIQTAKTILSKKTRLIQVTLPDGYQLLLRDTKNKTL